MIRRIITACSVLFWSCAAFAADTTTYSYDALGRLTASSVSGGPANGVNTGIALDPAGNRTSYSVTGATALLKASVHPKIEIASQAASTPRPQRAQQ